LLGNPSRDDLVRTVVEPARRAGYELSDPELAHEMVDVVAARPGALALLSFTASRLWELRDRRFHQLPRKAYEAMGGVAGALGRHAEETLTSLAGGDHQIVRDTFRHLVTADGTRAVLSLAELRQVLSNPRADAVIDKLVAARLLVISDADGDAKIEIAHEALIAAWPRLDTWIREDAEGARFRDQLRAAARQWNERGRPRGLLWRDEVLSDLERWCRRSDAALTDVEAAFADDSRGVAARGRRLRRGLLGLAIGVAVAAAFVFFALSRRADSAAADARRRLLDSYVENARTSLDGGKHWDAQRSLVAARKMGHDGPSFEIMRGLAREPARAMQFRIVANRGATYVVRFSPDGALLATAGEDGAALWNASTGALHVRLQGHAGGVRDVAFDAGGTRVATAGADATLRMWNVDDGRELGVLRDGDARLNAVVWRGDGAFLATGDAAGNVAVWSANDREPVMTVAVRDSVEALSFGRRYVALGSIGGDVLVVDPDRRETLLRAEHGERVRGIDLDSTETRLISGAADATVRIWNVETGAMLRELRGPSDWVTHAELSPDDTEVVATARDGTARIWDASTGALRRTLGGHQGTVWAGTFDPKGLVIATAAEDGSARLWDRTSGIELAAFEGHANLVRSVAFSPDGQRLATASYDGTVVMWSVQASYLIADWVGPTRRTCHFAQRHPELAAIACGEETRVYDLQRRQLIARLPGAEWVATWQTTAWTIDATTPAVRAWDLRTGAELASRPIGAIATSIATSDRGALIVGDATGGVRVFDEPGAAAGRVLAGGGDPISAVTALAGGAIAAVSTTGRVQVFAGDGAPVVLDGPRRSYYFEVSPDGREAVFIGGESADVGLLSIAGERPSIRWLKGHQAVVVAAYFEASGRLLTTSADGTALRWDLASGAAIQRFTGKHFITDVALDRSGRVLIALDGHGRLSYFDVESGRRLGSTTGNGRLGLRMWLLPGDTVAALDMGGGLTMWNVVFDRTPTPVLERDLACKAPGTVASCR
jgi:WD40 repeat protein